jgi:peptidoglycan hydrolase CwlO-like protein
VDKLRVELDELSHRVLELDQRDLGEQVDGINAELEELQGQFKKLRKKVKDR